MSWSDEVRSAWKVGGVGFVLGSLLAGGVVANLAAGIEQKVRLAFQRDMRDHVSASYPDATEPYRAAHPWLSEPQRTQVREIVSERVDARLSAIEGAVKEIRDELRGKRSGADARVLLGAPRTGG